MQGLIDSLNYVIHGNLFWQSMRMTAATAMFIGAIIFHQSTKNAFGKAITSLMTYAFFLIFTSLARVNPHITNDIISTKTYASAITTTLITLAYLFGLIIGFCLLKGRTK